jgi:1-acyl-sn-glycerol-3-phosphate acyltransferase
LFFILHSSLPRSSFVFVVSEQSANANGRSQCGGARADAFMLPDWALEIIRPAGLALSRALWKIRYQGIENVPLKGGLIIAANHQTYFDPFWLGFPIMRPLRFLAWSEIFGWPLVGKLPGLFGAWPLDVAKSDPTAIKRSLQWLRSGGAIVIFPEGERALATGTMRRFKNGAARLALETHVPILPITIRGAHRVWPKDRRFPRSAQVEIIYHPPHQVTLHEGEDIRCAARRESDQLAEIIASAL